MKTLVIDGVSGGIAVSKITMGTTYLGTGIPDSVSFDLLDVYYDLGGRTIDTARVYGQSADCGPSKSESLVGEWLRRRGVRDKVTLITKGCHSSHGTARGRLTPEALNRDLNDSLSSLGVDCVDLYFLHRDDLSQPVEPIMDALDALVKAGKIRGAGASNWSLDRILQANAYAMKNGKTPFCVSQIQWSLAKCTNGLWGDPDLIFMDAAALRRYQKENIPVMAYSSQAKGLFSKYLADPGAPITPKAKRFYTPENMRKLEMIKKIQDETGASPAAIVTAYITSHPLRGAAVIGCSNTAQLRDTLSGQDLTLTPEMVSALEEA